MFLDNLIFKSYEDQIEKATFARKKQLDEEVEDLRMWAERWTGEVNVPERKHMRVPVMLEIKGEPVEVYEEKLWWPLESANKDMLRHVDNRIVEAFRSVKKIGFTRPSTVLYGRMFLHVHSEETGKQYDNRPDNWASVSLLLRRMWGTTRIAYRYEQPDTLGKRVIEDKDGSVILKHGKKQWRDELINRGVIPKK